MDGCAAVYVKDAAAAASVKGKLGEAAVKSALADAGAPTPTTVSAPVEKPADASDSASSFFERTSKTTSVLAIVFTATMMSMCVA